MRTLMVIGSAIRADQRAAAWAMPVIICWDALPALVMLKVRAAGARDAPSRQTATAANNGVVRFISSSFEVLDVVAGAVFAMSSMAGRVFVKPEGRWRILTSMKLSRFW